MRRRFFFDQVRLGHAEIAGEDAKHLTRVLRVEPGQRYEISDNENVYLAEVESATKGHVKFRTLEKLAAEEAPVHITLYASLIKFDHFEWMVEKATELGVSAIVPVIAERSEHGLEKAAPKRLERWQRIAHEASQQSRRAYLPEIKDAAELSEAVRSAARYRYVLDEDGGAGLLAVVPAEPAPGDTVALLIGPEGGWTDSEREQFAGWTAVGMGALILRAETAAMAALAIVGEVWRNAPDTNPSTNAATKQ